MFAGNQPPVVNTNYEADNPNLPTTTNQTNQNSGIQQLRSHHQQLPTEQYMHCNSQTLDIISKNFWSRPIWHGMVVVH